MRVTLKSNKKKMSRGKKKEISQKKREMKVKRKKVCAVCFSKTVL